MTTAKTSLALVGTEPDDGYRLQEQIGFVLRKAHQLLIYYPLPS